MEIHGSLLALSLDDFQTALNESNAADILSDAMDIDLDNSSIDTIKQDNIQTSTPIKHSDVEIEPENSTFVSALSHTIFLPTNVGAKYAMKLLPAPSSPVDGEFDTSSSRALVTRHINSFSSSDNSIFLNGEPEFVYNPSKKDYDEDIYNNSMSQSYLYRRYNRGSPTPSKNIDTSEDLRYSNISNMSNVSNATPTSIQVHHHHYYYSPGKSEHLMSREVSGISKDETSYLSLNNTSDAVELPAPWKHESIPKEKYPYIISTYIQMVINFGVSIYGIYLVYNAINTIGKDIEVKLFQQSADLLAEIEDCAKKYYDNNCSPDLIVPALEKPCNYWYKCMNQNPNPNNGNKSSITAETLGLILNSLIEPLGLKFFILFFSFLTLIFLFNFTLGFIRARTYYGDKPAS